MTELKIGGKKLNREELMAMVEKDWHEPTYFIGYGSLMYPDGINGRGMKHHYEWKDLIPVEVTGFKRSFCAVFKNLAFYGIYEHQGGGMNCVAFKIDTLHDFAMLLADEGAHPIFKPPLYNVRNVAEHAKGFGKMKDFDFGKGAQVMILETRNVNEDSGYLPEYYINGTWNGIQPWGTAFSKRFLETGGVEYRRQNFTVRVPSPWSGNKLLASKRRKDRGSEIPCMERS